MSDARVRGGGMLMALMLACGGAPRGGAEAPAEPSPEHGSDVEGSEPAAPDEPAAAENPEPPSDSPRAAKKADAAPTGDALPTRCAAADELCLPPRPFVKKLCQDAYTGVALRLFDKSSPFSRGYVRSREVQAVNTLGGPSSDQMLRFEEEVLILSHSGGAAAHEMQVSGMGGYAVLRWDGTCATLSEGELGTRAPRSPGHAPLAWKYIDSNIQAALLRDATIEAARRQHRKHCHGVSLGRISAACARAEADLSQSIVTAVRAGIDLPTPDRTP